ncbi:hypothetical protein SBF1_1590019 [Candidatus Desulfosporosinus infrequens]|uniref:Uncharacterized protein n=1 Tax=Candidatus Desulfosporosinus infrequens TaxID=2043169 RepID=A0A2U3K9B3_9FIRM|nr:hypothetical protein SBF1_1590019 [Candidatus Desulfosporosinus infrequens]
MLRQILAGVLKYVGQILIVAEPVAMVVAGAAEVVVAANYV